MTPKGLYGANKNTGLNLFSRAVELTMDWALGKVEYAQALLMLQGDSMMDEANRLYLLAANAKPMDAMERLYVEMARTQLDDSTPARDHGSTYASQVLQTSAPADRSTDKVIGIDMGVAQPVVLSNGQKFELPKATVGDRAHLAKLQQAVSRKKKGSHNRNKAIKRLSVFKAHQARVRRDAMEKVTTAIAKNHGVVAMEDLRIQNMTTSAKGTVEEPGKNVAQKSGLNRSILDVAPGAFRMRLGQKLAASGGMLLLVAPHHTSRRCSKCGHTSAENRVERDWFACTKCCHAEDADVNAAENIGQRALGLWGDADKVEVANSLALLLTQQAKPKRGFKKKLAEGLSATACRVRSGLRHGQSRKRVAATQSRRASHA